MQCILKSKRIIIFSYLTLKAFFLSDPLLGPATEEVEADDAVAAPEGVMGEAGPPEV